MKSIINIYACTFDTRWGDWKSYNQPGPNPAICNICFRIPET